MLALGTTCLHPTTQKPYILSLTGGKDHSPEGAQVSPRPAIGKTSLAEVLTGSQNGITHAFTVEFGSKADRDYYVKTDPVHQAFIKYAGDVVEKAIVVDYTVGEF